MDKRALFLGLAAVLIAAFWVYFGLQGQTGLGALSAQPEIPGQKETVKIGVVLPLSGVRADGGKYMSNALNLAKDEINSDQNRKFSVKLVFEDGKYESQAAVSAIQKLISIDEAGFVIGEIGSSPTLAMAPIAEKNKVILISPWAQSVELSKAGDYIFRTQINSLQESVFWADFISKRAKTLGIIGINTAFLPSYLGGFNPRFESQGGKVLASEKVSQDATDFSTELLKIKATAPEGILIVSSAKQSSQILKQAVELGISANFFATSNIESAEFLKATGTSVNGVLFPAAYNSDDPRSAAVSFRQKYSNRFNEPTFAESAIAYDTLYILANCLEKSGTNTVDVKQCLYGTQDFDGASGIISFDKNGDVKKDFMVKTVKNGEFVPLE